MTEAKVVAMKLVIIMKGEMPYTLTRSLFIHSSISSQLLSAYEG